MKEDLYKWYPIVDEGEYWTDYDIANVLSPSLNKIQTIVTNGARIYTYHECNFGWGTMAKSGCWKYMRIKLDDSICRDESFDGEMCRLGI
jgi:hypothetical protein